ncbi:hypothetical protein E3P89_03180 [Wallemia ichthyophaga]|uniref:Uncharacterized protein n=1 Tax=Wallemia ichthyophaga TaxID=245174 RepID=A0A4T0I1L8_WALIC|nr:hypothetical protein E3P93_03170 [Wallemia ichthyophaga]TIB09661.1 hypothetical protein E3P90_03201 [Wallemia ichthyophaga]TIB20501.1 hypothetical protein E3P89_03180 [Wallemia ichthyophaga]TIB22055.1 hypothetical protein E3P88_03214 [Wallemia ichthyophaga]
MSIYSLLTHSITRSDTDAFTQPSSSSGSSNSNSVDTHLKALLVEMHNILNTLPTSLTNIYQEIQTDRQSELFNTRNLGSLLNTLYSFADDLNRRLHLSAIEQSKFNVQMLDEIKALSNRQLEINTAMMQRYNSSSNNNNNRSITSIINKSALIHPTNPLKLTLFLWQQKC